VPHALLKLPRRRRITANLNKKWIMLPQFDHQGYFPHARGPRRRASAAACFGGWRSEAPVAFRAGDTNLFRYVGNLPSGRTDPSGEAAPPVLLDPREKMLDKTYSVKATDVLAPTGGKNGAYGWVVNWDVSPKATKLGGWVVQEYNVEWSARDVKTKQPVEHGTFKKANKVSWYEAWPVKPNSTTAVNPLSTAGRTRYAATITQALQLKNPLSANYHDAFFDNGLWPGNAVTEGHWNINSVVWYFPNVDFLPLKMKAGSVIGAGPLRAMFSNSTNDPIWLQFIATHTHSPPYYRGLRAHWGPETKNEVIIDASYSGPLSPAALSKVCEGLPAPFNLGSEILK
jgi:hypothetical protein